MSELSLTEVVARTGNSSRRGARAAKRRRKQRRRRSWVILLVGLLVIGGAVAGAWVVVRPMIASLTAPNDWTGDGSGTVDVVVAPGANGTQIAQVLAAKGVVKTSKAFIDAFKANPEAGSLQPGTYRIHLHMSAASALAMLLNPADRLELKVNVPEGQRLRQILDRLASALKLDRGALTAALKDPRLALPAQAKGNAEGWLFPATYAFAPGVTALQVEQAMLARTYQALDDAGVPKDQRYRVLIEASLVQAEAGHEQDMGKIARVLTTRLARNIPLQLDTTIHYATGRFTVSTTTKDTQIASPYNTYLHLGLPPAPICSPGEAAMKAVMTPTPGPWLYFVAVNPDTGLTKFAVTKQEFEALQAEYNAWQRAHPGK